MTAAAPRPVVTEHGFEPVPGLPERLPAGETLLWQGRPGWRGLARGALYIRGIAAYFVLLALWRGAAVTGDGGSGFEVAAAAGTMLLIGVLPIGFLLLYAWFAARDALYTITSRRIVMRVGLALPVTINLPFALVEGAALLRRADGSGDIVLHLAKGQRASWLALWPHARPWRFTNPAPMLRALADVDGVAQILGRALAGSAAAPVRALDAGQSNASPARPAAEAVA